MHIGISNVYNDGNRGGSLLTLAAYQMVNRALESPRVTLFATADTVETGYDFTLRHCADATLEPNPVPTGPTLGAKIRRRLITGKKPPGLGRIEHFWMSKGTSLPLTNGVIGKGGQLFRKCSTPAERRNFASSSYPLAHAARHGNPAIAYGVQVSPIEEANKNSIEPVLERLDLVVARDPRSADVAHAAGAQRVVLAPDSAFGIDLPQRSAVDAAPNQPYGVFVTHYSMSDGPHFERATRLASALVKSAISGHIERILILSQAGTARQRDDVAAAQLVERLGDERATLVRERLTTEQLLNLYGSASVVVSGRVHGAIMGLLMGTPSFVIDTTHDKAENLFTGMGLQRFVLGKDLKGDSSFIDMQSESPINADTDRGRIREEVRTLRDQVRAVDKVVAEVLS